MLKRSPSLQYSITRHILPSSCIITSCRSTIFGWPCRRFNDWISWTTFLWRRSSSLRFSIIFTATLVLVRSSMPTTTYSDLNQVSDEDIRPRKESYRFLNAPAMFYLHLTRPYDPCPSVLVSLYCPTISGPLVPVFLRFLSRGTPDNTTGGDCESSTLSDSM